MILLLSGCAASLGNAALCACFLVAQAIVRAADKLVTQPSATETSSESGTDAAFSGRQGGASPGQLQPGTFMQEPGSGVLGVVDGVRVAVGTLEWLQRQGATVTDSERITDTMDGPVAGGGDGPSSSGRLALAPSGVGSSHSRVFVSVGSELVGAIDVQDSVRGDAAGTIELLHAQGIRTVMLSGDHRGAALEVAQAVGIKEGDVYAGVKPAGTRAHQPRTAKQTWWCRV